MRLPGRAPPEPSKGAGGGEGEAAVPQAVPASPLPPL